MSLHSLGRLSKLMNGAYDFQRVCRPKGYTLSMTRVTACMKKFKKNSFSNINIFTYLKRECENFVAIDA